MNCALVLTGWLIGGTISITASLGMSEAWATMNLTARCKDNFIGRVTAVKSSQAPPSKLAMVDVEFSTQKDSALKSITVLRDGPHKYQIGQVYDVGLNQGFVCRMERIED